MNTQHVILVVEDEEPVLLALSDVLKGEGFEVLTARNGKEGLATAIAKRPHMILADLKMPEMGGIEMVLNLRSDPWGKEVPVMFLTNLADGETVEEAQELGAVDYFIKGDMRMAEIVERIKSRLHIQ